MSDRLFDIYGFDENLLDVPTFLAAAHQFTGTIQETQQIGGWTLTRVVDNDARFIVRFDPLDANTYPSLKFTHYHHEPDLAQRTFSILQALQEFGVGTAARPFYASSDAENFSGSVLICEWIGGEPLKRYPTVDEEEMWHRMMATLGFQKNLPFGKYANTIPMRGLGIQNPVDLFRWLDEELALVDDKHTDYAQLAELVANVRAKVHPTWRTLPQIGISRLDPAYEHLIWDGHHLRVTGWSQTDWADVAFDIAQLAADPLYEDLPMSHWVWFRWEYARLTHDDGLVARATTYTQILNLYWAIKLTHQMANATDEKRQQRLGQQRDRYLKKAQKSFG